MTSPACTCDGATVSSDAFASGGWMLSPHATSPTIAHAISVNPFIVAKDTKPARPAGDDSPATYCEAAPGTSHPHEAKLHFAGCHRVNARDVELAAAHHERDLHRAGALEHEVRQRRARCSHVGAPAVDLIGRGVGLCRIDVEVRERVSHVVGDLA